MKIKTKIGLELILIIKEMIIMYQEDMMKQVHNQTDPLITTKEMQEIIEVAFLPILPKMIIGKFQIIKLLK
jgi:hypothetical protein